MAVSVGFTMLDNFTTEHMCPFADSNHRIIARVRSFILHYELCKLLRIERHFRDESTIHSRKVGTDQTGFTAISAEQFDHPDAFMRAGARSKLVNKLYASSDRSAKSDTVISAKNIVIHRLRDGYDFYTFTMQALTITQRIVAPDGHQYSYTEISE